MEGNKGAKRNSRMVHTSSAHQRVCVHSDSICQATLTRVSSRVHKFHPLQHADLSLWLCSDQVEAAVYQDQGHIVAGKKDAEANKE